MHILVGLVLAAVLLFVWLIGHWFARVLAFLLLACVFGLSGAFMAGIDGPPAHNHGIAGALLGLLLAWFVSGIPIYVRRYQARGTSMELTLR